jgi:hypothetical protein
VLGADAVEGEHLADLERSGRDPATEGVQDAGVLAGRRGRVHWFILSSTAFGKKEPVNLG